MYLLLLVLVGAGSLSPQPVIAIPATPTTSPARSIESEEKEGFNLILFAHSEVRHEVVTTWALRDVVQWVACDVLGVSVSKGVISAAGVNRATTTREGVQNEDGDSARRVLLNLGFSVRSHNCFSWTSNGRKAIVCYELSALNWALRTL